VKPEIPRTGDERQRPRGRAIDPKYTPRGIGGPVLATANPNRCMYRTYPCIDPPPNHSILVGAARCRVGVSRCRGRRVRAVRRSIVDSSCAHVRPSRADACRCRRRRAAFSRAGISIAISSGPSSRPRIPPRELGEARPRILDRRRGAGTCDTSAKVR